MRVIPIFWKTWIVHLGKERKRKKLRKWDAMSVIVMKGGFELNMMVRSFRGVIDKGLGVDRRGRLLVGWLTFHPCDPCLASIPPCHPLSDRARCSSRILFVHAKYECHRPPTGVYVSQNHFLLTWCSLNERHPSREKK